MSYEIKVGEKKLICSRRDGYYYSSERLTEEDFKGKVEIRYEGMKGVIKHPIVKVEDTENGSKFSIREMTAEDKAEASKAKAKAKEKRHNKWINESYDRVSVALPKGTKERISALGYSVSGFINEAVKVLLEASES